MPATPGPPRYQAAAPLPEILLRVATMSVEGRPLTGVVAITGGARGIGLATATELVARGAAVAIGDVDEPAAVTAAQQLGPNATGFALDVTDRGSFATFIEATIQRHGRLGVLVNNAGIQHIGAFVDESDAATDRQLAVNLHGVLTGTKLALAHMYRHRRGHVVNIASVAGKVAAPGGATYSATKHAVVGLGEALRGELRDTGVRVSTVIPAIVATEMSDGLIAPRGVGPVDPAMVAKAIVRDVIRRRGRNIYVPARISAMTALMAVLPPQLRRAAERLLGSDNVLTNVDRSARGAYLSRTGITTGAVKLSKGNGAR
jgi:NAD(P)-dependent dehydrogenase (short-subunit alcohol dehydrogenase family)